MANGLLIRVAIDLTSGAGTHPCSGRNFCYVPWAFPIDRRLRSGLRPYREAVERLLTPSAPAPVPWPCRRPREAHFAPDIEHLTYGDGGQRAARIKDGLSRGSDNFIVFYASLRSVETTKLIYSIIGFLLLIAWWTLHAPTGIETLTHGPMVAHTLVRLSSLLRVVNLVG